MSQIIKIEMDGHGRGRVLVDDVQLDCVTAFRVRAGVGKSNQVILLLAPGSIEITGPFDVKTAQMKD